MTGFKGRSASSLLGAVWMVCTLAAAPGASAQATSSDTKGLLAERNYGALEASLSAVQSRFENGELTEQELQNAFKPFGKAAASTEQDLRDWVAATPNSYVAHLALGLFYREHGSAARGRKFMEDTPQENIDKMTHDFVLAEGELRKSLALTRKPYLSLLNLMAIAGNVGSRIQLDALLLLANEVAPRNAQARLRYGLFLMPRWGGTYERVDAFVALNRRQGVSESTVEQLQALEHNDRGLTLKAQGDHDGADAEFETALQLAQQSGGNLGFARQHLAASMRRLCDVDDASAVCPVTGGDWTMKAAVPAQSGEAAAFAGRAGDDLAHPVVVEASDELSGARIESAWRGLRYPGSRENSQGLLPRAGRWFDVLNITTADGRSVAAYFDITSFYGKLRAKAGAGKG